MNLQRHIPKTASRQKLFGCAFASGVNRPESRAASRVWARRRGKLASGESLYNYFRDYEPATGRYVQSDPVGLRGGINTYGYAMGRPLSHIDPKGLLVISPRCSAAKRKAIEDAEKEVRKKVDGSCSGCGGSAGCVPCEYFQQLQSLLDTTPVDCPDSNDAPSTQPPIRSCGWQQGKQMGITPIGFAGSTSQQDCGCLPSIIYHELLHVIVGNNDKHPEIYRAERACFSCGIGNRPPWNMGAQ